MTQEEEIILSRFVSALAIEPNKDYIIRYTTNNDIGLGYEEIQTYYNIIRERYPNNHFYFIPEDLTIMKNDKEEIDRCIEFLQNLKKEEEA